MKVREARRGAAHGRIADWIGNRSVDVGPIQIGFQAENPIARLPIVAERAADESATLIIRTRGHATGINLIRSAPATATVDADVEAGPIVKGSDSDRRLDRHVGG